MLRFKPPEYGMSSATHTTCHDQSDVARSENHDLTSRHLTFHVYEPLGSTGRVDACGSIARNGERAARTLATTHRKYDCPGLHAIDPSLLTHGMDHKVRRDVDYHGPQAELNAHFMCTVLIARRILGTRELLLERVQPEAVVDALVEDAPEPVVSLNHEHALAAALARGNGCRQPCGSATNNHDIIAQHVTRLPLERGAPIRGHTS